MDAAPYLLAVIVVLLLVISAVASIAGCEIASLTSANVKLWEHDKRLSFRRLFVLLQEPEKLIATIHITGLLANAAAVVIVACKIPLIVDQYNIVISVALVIAIVAGCVFLRIFLSFVFQKFAANKILSAFSVVFAFLQMLFFPLVFAMLWTTKLLTKRKTTSIDNLSNVFEKTSEASDGQNILKGIIKLENIDVHTIMTSRMDVQSIDSGADLSELIAKINEWGYSRIPVYDESPDIVKGILYVKDLLPFIDAPDDFRWQKLIRKAYFVPEHKKVGDLLKEFQKMKIHLAVIINEYGSMVGIITLEDILEEIVGDIADESDDDEQDYVKIDECTYLFDGKVLLNDFFKIMQLQEADFESIRGDADTLAGVILEMKGEIPKKGDCLEFMHLSFCVEAVDNRRIKQIKVIVNEK